MLFELQWSLQPKFNFAIEDLMATNKGFNFTASTSTDVVAYRVVLAKAGVQVGAKTYPDDASIKHATDPKKRTINLAADPAFPNLDGTYDVQVFAVDDASNDSPQPLAGTLTLDFVPPLAPTGFEPF